MYANSPRTKDSKGGPFALERGSSPPPYEATAYPKVQRSRYLHKLISLRLRVALLLALFLSLICLWRGHIGGPRPVVILSPLEEQKFQHGLTSCAAVHKSPARVEAKDRRENQRWNPKSGQNRIVILRNATLFDGTSFLEEAVDIVFSKGLIVSVGPTTANIPGAGEDEIIDLSGAYVTPGLVDMHSHHLAAAWPVLESVADGDEIHPDSGPLTPFVKVLDSLKAYDEATKLIASGGVTSSLVIPGSANIMGGEGTVVKNAWKPGPDGEFVVEEMLLEYGIGEEEKRRYMKMACGENPKSEWGHTRMGNIWTLRSWLAKAKDLVDRQEEWCEVAQMATTGWDRRQLLAGKGGFPEELELESTAALLRGRVAVHNHCYEPEDFGAMLRLSREWGIRVRAFHHAISAWQVPQMLIHYGENITIATFAEFALYKKEAYAASLSAGKILNNHGLPVAYKSDHYLEDTSSKYLMSQSAVGHSFGLPEDKALQAVTSVPAASLELDHRIGHVRPGYDADVVVWDSHPLSAGATPKQVFIDGIATLDPRKVEESSANVVVNEGDDASRGAGKPAMRAVVDGEERILFCSDAERPGQALVISGIRKSFLDEFPHLLPAARRKGPVGDNLTIIIEYGEIICLGEDADCEVAALEVHHRHYDEGVFTINLKNGHLTRGLIAITSTLGILEIGMDPETGDGRVKMPSPKDARDSDNIDYAKYAVNLGGSRVLSKPFSRARLGGVTRAIQAPYVEGGLIVGVSTGLRTGYSNTLLNGGLFQEDVAMHVALGNEAKADEGAVSMAITRLRRLVEDGGKVNKQMEDDEVNRQNPWALVANGSLPLVVKSDSTHDIQQTILLKNDYPQVRVVILGGHAAPLFADEIAKAKIPLILTATRPGPDMWTKKDSPPGPPLSRSPADTLSEAGVFYAIAILTNGGPAGDPRIQSLALEASWAAKYAGLSEHDALGLVSTNVEEILGLEKSGDIVVWENNPLHFGTPVLAFQEKDGKLTVSSCWPNEAEDH